MKVFFLRHGIAADPTTWDGADADRPLTAIGRRRVGSVARAIARMDAGIELIATSPYLRALQTAKLVARHLDMVDRLKVEPSLASGFNAAALAQLLEARRHVSALLLVGHEPDFSHTISELIGGARLRCKKAGLARVDLRSTQPMLGELIWLVPPKLLVQLGVGSRSR